jgi:hypothetical protein
MNESEKKEAWEEIMNKAEEAGFIHFAYGGVAILNVDEGKKDETG